MVLHALSLQAGPHVVWSIWAQGPSVAGETWLRATGTLSLGKCSIVSVSHHGSMAVDACCGVLADM